jgi:hypothetical protein
MNSNAANDIITSITETIDIPDSAYDKAIARAKDLETWIDASSESAKFEAKVSVQGSFRLGTVNRPLREDDEYDLDLSWLLRHGYGKDQHLQAELKALVGRDLEAYRRARQIETAREEKNRCWRLHYKDDIRFHLDGHLRLGQPADRCLNRKRMARWYCDQVPISGLTLSGRFQSKAMDCAGRSPASQPP